jgi:WD40 repeat protein
LREPMPGYAGGTFRGASADGRYFAVFKKDTLTLLDTETLQELAALKPAKEGISVAIGPDGSRLGLGYWHSDKVWLLEKRATGTVIGLKHTLTNQAAFCGNPIFGPDGKRVAIHWGTSVAMFEPATGKQLWSLPVDDLPIYALSPDGQVLAVRSGKRQVRLVAAESGTVLATLANPNGMPVRQVFFSGDNASLAMLSDGLSEVFVWDLGRLRSELGQIGLDWSQPPIAAATNQEDSKAIRLIISESGSQPPTTAANPTTQTPP